MKTKSINLILFQISLCIALSVFSIITLAKKHHYHIEWIKAKKTLPILTEIKLLKKKKDLEQITFTRIPEVKNDSFSVDNSQCISIENPKNDEQVLSASSSLSSTKSVQQKKLVRNIFLIKKIEAIKSKINQKLLPIKETENHPSDFEIQKKYGRLSIIFGVLGLLLLPTIVFSILAIYYGRKAHSNPLGKIGIGLGILGLIFLLFDIVVLTWLIIAYM